MWTAALLDAVLGGAAGGPFLCFFLVIFPSRLELLVSGIFFVTGMAATNMFRGPWFNHHRSPN